MESELLTQVFRRLFSHDVCSKVRSRALIRRTNLNTPRKRWYRSPKDDRSMDDYDARRESDWQQRSLLFPPDKTKEYDKYPMVTFDQLKNRNRRPTRVKMLTRDFIDDSLYNPHYGYFPQNVTIFSPGSPFDFNSLPNELAFQADLSKRYTDFEDKLDEKEENETRQLWHTPTELFRPYYGQAFARYLVTNYKLRNFPFHDLIIYELGAGNGTLMLNVLDYIRDYHPDIYHRTHYKVIEISASLAGLQTSQIHKNASTRGHASRIEIINKSVFDWTVPVTDPCYILALEVFDNFAHDVMRYDHYTEQPLQGTVLIDTHGDFYEFYSQDIDPLASRFLQVREAACTHPFKHPLRGSGRLRRFKAGFSFGGNLTVPEYIPTRLLSFFSILGTYFPQHQLLASDFSSLPDSIEGFNAPVVQTRYRRRTVPVTTPYVMQGFFDILFPTDFAVVEEIYRAITGRFTRVMGQREFLEGWGDLEGTLTKNGENPMLTWYKNSSVMIST